MATVRVVENGSVRQFDMEGVPRPGDTIRLYLQAGATGPRLVKVREVVWDTEYGVPEAHVR